MGLPQVLHKFTVELPKKHGRGGQSALRFARLRMEKRHNYVRKVRSPSASVASGQSVVLPSGTSVWMRKTCPIDTCST